MELLGELPVVMVGALAGAGCGIVAAVIALPGVRQFTDPPEVDTTDFSTPWAVVVGSRRGRRSCCSPRSGWRPRAGPRAGPH